MVKLNAYYDGRAIVPDEPLSLAPNQRLRITIESIGPALSGDQQTANRRRVLGRQPGAVTFLAPDWDAPLPDDIWDHNKDNRSKP